KSGVSYVSWQIFWREDGKARSTSRRSEDAATVLADEIAVRLAKGEIKQRILTGLELADYEKASLLCTDTGASLIEAARFYAVEWQKQKILEIKGPDLVAEFLAAKKQDGLSQRYRDDARLRLKKFCKAFPDHISGIRSRDLDDFLRGLTVSIRSRDNVHKILKSLFSYARARGYLPASERTAAEILARTKFKPPVIGILQPDEFGRTLRAASPKTLPAFVLGGFCGIRQAEICRLDWSAIDFNRNLITVNACIAKTSRRRLVPLHAAAAAWLAPIAKTTGPVIEYSSPINLSQMMRTAWQEAQANRSQNCLRHSGASYRLAVTGNAPETALELGTSVQMLMQHYRELVTKDEAQAWFSIFPQSQDEQQEIETYVTP
ncbi:MAG: tyrosine-type recombinase/integrase, partial [Chthoniobacterales bacterium]